LQHTFDVLPCWFPSGLSVPFSSGFALQRSTVQCIRKQTRIFQFPFPRDSPCNAQPGRCFFDARRSFQFPFPRDSPCNRPCRSLACQRGSPFSSLFLGIRLATRAGSER